MIPPVDPASGLLPLGRHHCTEAEVEAAFVSASGFATSSSRAAIWSAWQQAVAFLQTAVTVHAAWLGGSFTTSKMDPEDLDATFIVNADDYRRRSTPEQQIVTLFATSQVRTRLSLRVDSYIIPWEQTPQPLSPGFGPFQERYFRQRGYWDDWWQRQRQTPKTNPPTPPNPRDAVPLRGYLEVPFSAYP